MDEKRRIQAIIEARDDLTVRNVALKAGLSDSALHKFLTVEDQSMSIRNLRRVAEAMEVSLRYILFGEEGELEILSLWDRVAQRDREKAKAVLRAFANEKKGSA